MLLPNFLCIGAQKAGTTLLYELLKDIDTIYLPTTKEIHFFDQTHTYEKGLEWYAKSYFNEAKEGLAIGEITPSYLFIEQSPQRIKESLGDGVKFIVILRNPIKRAYSHYTMKYKTKEELNSFNDALILESKRTVGNIELNKKFSYLKRGLYSKQIQNYLKYFKKENFLFIEFEEFVKNQDSTILKICNFLGVEKNKVLKSKVIHSSKLSLGEKINFSLLNKNYNILDILTTSSYPKMSKTTKKLLINYFEDDVKSLEKFIDKDLSKWLQ